MELKRNWMAGEYKSAARTKALEFMQPSISHKQAHVLMFPSRQCVDIIEAVDKKVFHPTTIIHAIERDKDNITGGDGQYAGMSYNLTMLGYLPRNRFIYNCDFDDLDINEVKRNLNGKLFDSGFNDFCGNATHALNAKMKETSSLYKRNARVLFTFALSPRGNNDIYLKKNFTKRFDKLKLDFVSLEQNGDEENPTGIVQMTKTPKLFNAYKGSVLAVLDAFACDINFTFTYRDGRMPMVLIGATLN